MRSDKPEHVQFEEEEHGENYIKDRVKSLALVKNLTFLTILLLIAQIVLDIIHLTIHGLGLAISLLTTAVVFLISAGIIIYWSGQATKAYKANTELFQPRVNDKLTKTVYIGALIFAATCVVLLINLLAQREYSPDYVVAHSAVQATWDEHYGGRTVAGINKFLRVISWIQVGFNIYYIIYFLVVARTAFKCLKFDNQAMSYLVFLGNTLLLAFGLGIVFLADHALGYSEYPQIKEHFPFWNIKGLYFAGVCVSVVSLIGFLVDHRSWRVGFFVLSFLLLVNIVLLGNFSGFAFRHIKETYDYYKGTGDIANCVDRMQYVNLHDLEHEGCPQKYLPAGTQCDNEPVTPWEQIETDVRQAERTRQPAAPTQTVTPAEAAQAQQEAAAAAAEAAAATQQAQDATAQAAEAQQAAADAQQAAADNQQATADQAAADQAAADQAAADQAAADQAAAQAAADQAAADQAAADQAAAQAAADQAAADQAAAQAAANQAAADQAAADQAAADQAAADQAAADQAANDQTPTTTATPGEQQQTAADQQAAADNQQATADQSSAAADQQQAVADQQQANADQQQANADTASDNATPASMLMEFTVMRKLQQSEDGKYCYNTKCCGLLGQLYTRDLLRLANFAVLAMLAAILISIACYYFWFVKWVDAARDKRKDYVWLFIMVLILVGFIVAMAAWNLPYVAEQLDANGRHMFAWSW